MKVPALTCCREQYVSGCRRCDVHVGTLPSSSIHKGSENRSVVMIRKIDQWNQDRKEPQDVQDQDQTFEMSESFAANRVDYNRKCKYRPAEEHSLVGFRRVICVQHQDGTLQDSPGQIGRRSGRCLPPNQCDPSRNEAEEIPA
jgi:hypothetical protein